MNSDHQSSLWKPFNGKDIQMKILQPFSNQSSKKFWVKIFQSYEFHRVTTPFVENLDLNEFGNHFLLLNLNTSRQCVERDWR